MTLGPLTWFFDLDNTLHDASFRIFATIDGTMNSYIERHLQVSPAEADRLRRSYWKRYGATLLGLVRHHNVKAEHFLEETHSFVEQAQVGELIRSEAGLERLLTRLPGRKVLLTNAPARYAQVVVNSLGIHRHFRRRYAIEHMRIHGRFRPKPSRAMLRMLLVREGVRPGAAVLVEDSPQNLKSARSLGLKTVLVNGHTPPLGSKRKTRPAYVDLQVKSISQLALRYRRLR
ncbi:MAG: pyrimidine 5'-nucleotidase [Burkholderiaceae bacterium]